MESPSESLGRSGRRPGACCHMLDQPEEGSLIIPLDSGSTRAAGPTLCLELMTSHRLAERPPALSHHDRGSLVTRRRCLHAQGREPRSGTWGPTRSLCILPAHRTNAPMVQVYPLLPGAWDLP